jgi:hypothetical protein
MACVSRDNRVTYSKLHSTKAVPGGFVGFRNGAHEVSVLLGFVPDISFRCGDVIFRHLMYNELI